MEYLGLNKVVNKISPIVSVCVITYNHEEYISECLDSILMQELDFPYEIILGEDDSTDKTREICIDYADRYPDKIRLFLREEKDKIYINGRKTGRFNILECFKDSRGKYISLCEGDDYWKDPLKLQKQVDFLEKNKNIVASFTNAIVKNEIKNKENIFVRNLSEGIVTSKNLIMRGGGIFPTASLVFNREVLKDSFFSEVIDLEGLYGDEVLIFALMQKGQIYFHDKNMVVYRRWSGGIYSSTHYSEVINLKKKSIKNYRIFKSVLNRKYSRLINRKISQDSLYIYLNLKDRDRFKYLLNVLPIDLLKLIYRRLK